MIDFVGTLEDIQTDFDVICDRTGVSKRKLAHTNKSKHRDFAEYYNSRTRDIVAQAYATDIKKFGYSFDAPVKTPGIIRNFLDQHL